MSQYQNIKSDTYFADMLTPSLSSQGSSSSSETAPSECSTSSSTEPVFEPVAIVGMSCKLPGGVDSPSKFWELLTQARSAHCEVPERAYNVFGRNNPDTNRPGSLPSTGGYFIQEDVRQFDNAFFNINNLEATYMDPQQRKLLETVYECLESSGQTLETVSGSKIGCYVGNFTNDWAIMQYKDADYASHYSATGSAPSILANRLSYIFGLRGPSLTIDTACSSAAYSLHLACQAIYNDDCNSAIVASANLIQTPEQTIQATKAGILSDDSTCHTFDASAAGYGRGEAVSAIFVKRLSDAIREGDPIRAVIRATAINANGKTAGISYPGAIGQTDAVRTAYARAKLSVEDTQYVEAHGTGTAVGDPIEVEGLVNALRPHPSRNKLFIGSVKTNVGHSEGASAITSIIKVVLALEKGVIPPTIGLKTLNPRLEAFEKQVGIVTETMSWPDTPIRRAGVNSFGFGGANGHIILEAADARMMRSPRKEGRSGAGKNAYIVPISARSEASLSMMSQGLAKLASSGLPLPDLAHTLGSRRSVFSHRSYMVLGETPDGFEIRARAKSAMPTTSSSSCLTMVFTGQGAQWRGMGSSLRSHFPVFRSSITKMDAHLRTLKHAPSWTIAELLDDSGHKWDINAPAISQPLCTVLQVALVDLLKDWNIVPELVVGHSSGEIAAAYCAGALTAMEALAVAYYRGYAVSQSKQKGAMAAVGLGREALEKQISAYDLNGSVKVACVNSPESTTISGDSSAVELLVERLSQQSIFARLLRTQGMAYHSHHMELVADQYEALLSSALDQSSNSVRQLRTKLISTVVSVTANVSELASPSYWRRNLTFPVLFGPVIQQLLEDHSEISLIEIGPHSVLKMPLQQCHTAHCSANNSQGKRTELPYSSCLIRDKSGVDSVLSLVGDLFTQGGTSIPFDRINSAQEASVLSNLPNYPWEYKQTLWKESRLSQEYRQQKYPRHLLLGARVPGGSGVIWSWQNVIRKRDVPWLEDHAIEGKIVYPAAGYLIMATEAMRQFLDVASLQGFVTIHNFKISKALMIPEGDSGVDVVTDLQRYPISETVRSKRWFMFEIHSVSSQGITVHATGRIAIERKPPTGWATLETLPDVYESYEANAWYERLSNQGFALRGKFKTIQQVSRLNSSSVESYCVRTDIKRDTEVQSKSTPEEGVGHLLSIDSALQTAILSATGGVFQKLTPRLPVAIEQIRFNLDMSSLQEGFVFATSRASGQGATRHNAKILNSDGSLYAYLRNVSLNEYISHRNESISGAQDPVLRISWKPDLEYIQTDNVPALKSYLQERVLESHDTSSSLHAKACSLVDLLVHKKAASNICFIGSLQDSLLARIIDKLQPVSGVRRLNSLAVAMFDRDNLQGRFVDEVMPINHTINYLDALQPQDIKDLSQFDLIIVTDDASREEVSEAFHHLNDDDKPSSTYILKIGSKVTKVSNGRHSPFELVYQETSEEPSQGCTEALHLLRVPYFSSKMVDRKESPSPLVVIHSTPPTALEQALLSRLRQSKRFDVLATSFTAVSEQSIPQQAICIVSAELSRSVLASVTPQELTGLKYVSNNARVLVWITAGAVMDCSQPDLAAVAGLARAVMVEQPRLKFLTLDLGQNDSLGVFERQTYDNLISIISNLSKTEPEYEFAQRNGMLWSSRFVPDDKCNDTFRLKHRQQVKKIKFSELERCKLAGVVPDATDELLFEKSSPQELRAGFVEIKVKTAGLNHRSAALLNGKVESRDGNSISDFGGIVSAVHSDTTQLSVGDKVLVMSPSQLGTHVIAPEWACVKLHQAECLVETSSLPSAFSTALFALDHIAPLDDSQSILITAAENSTGQALLQIAQTKTAKIFVTAGSEDQRQMLMEQYGLDDRQVLPSDSEQLVQQIYDSTDGEGVDIMVGAIEIDVLNRAIQSCSKQGSIVYIPEGQADGLGSLDISQTRGARSINIVNLDDIFHSKRKSHQKLWSDLLQSTVKLYRKGAIRPLAPVRTFDISDAGKAFRQLIQGRQNEKLAITLQKDDASVNYRPLRHQATFHPSKTYILVGGLGGLGRSISKWMVRQGAKKLVFLSRSGSEKAAARQLVGELERAGAKVRVVRGTVDSADDVQSLVDGIEGVIGGVIHAAMGLYDTLFSSMTSDQWNGALSPKIKGSWNLHQALFGREYGLDFFLLMSSNTGSVGTAAESNYSAANSFLDSFARFRQSRGLKAVSVGLGMISEVGYVHENPEVEKILLRKGLYPLSEDEMIQILDIAISEESNSAISALDYHKGHLLTGLELISLEKQREQGFEGNFTPLKDPRFSLLAYDFERRMKARKEGGKRSGPASDDSFAVASNIHSSDPTQRRAAVTAIIVQKLANLILVPEESLNEDTLLAPFGMDSLLASQYRTQVRNVIGVDIPFVTLLDNGTSVATLVDIVIGKLD